MTRLFTGALLVLALLVLGAALTTLFVMGAGVGP